MSMPYVEPKPRPRAWWFALGGGLMVVALLVCAVSVASFVRELAHTDARFPADGAHTVVLPAHVTRALFVDDLDPSGSAPFGFVPCLVQDDHGVDVTMRPHDSRDDFNGWVPVATFDTGDGHLTFDCADNGGIREVRIAALPDGRDVVRLVLVGFVVPGLLGVCGFVVVLVAGILWFSRRRPPPPPRYGPPGPSYAPYPPQGPHGPAPAR